MCVCLLCAYVSLEPDQASGSEFKFSQRSDSESQTTLFDCMTLGVKAWWWGRRWGQGEKTESTDVVIKFKSVLFIQLCIVDSGTHAFLSLSRYLLVSLSILHVCRPYFRPEYPQWVQSWASSRTRLWVLCSLFLLCVRVHQPCTSSGEQRIRAFVHFSILIKVWVH